MQTLKAIVLVMSFLLSNTALAVTGSEASTVGEEVNHLMTSVAERAEADVQIRRIKNLLLTQEIDGDAAFEELEKLQNSLRGQK